MNVHSVTAVLMVNNIDEALRFYRDILGMGVLAEEEDWALLEGGFGLMTSPEPLPEDNIQLNRIMLSLEVTDIQQAYNELTGCAVAFLLPPTHVSGGIAATLRDTEGNLVQLVQKNAVFN